MVNSKDTTYFKTNNFNKNNFISLKQNLAIIKSNNLNQNAIKIEENFN